MKRKCEDNDYNKKGWKQRAALHKASSKSSERKSTESALAKELLGQKNFGFLKCSQVQRIAAAATQGGLNHPSVVKLAGIGHNGTIEGNLNRDFGRLLLPFELVVSLMTFFVTLFDQKIGHRPVRQVLMLPHVFFRSIVSILPICI